MTPTSRTPAPVSVNSLPFPRKYPSLPSLRPPTPPKKSSSSTRSVSTSSNRSRGSLSNLDISLPSLRPGLDDAICGLETRRSAPALIRSDDVESDDSGFGESPLSSAEHRTPEDAEDKDIPDIIDCTKGMVADHSHPSQSKISTLTKKIASTEMNTQQPCTRPLIVISTTVTPSNPPASFPSYVSGPTPPPPATSSPPTCPSCTTHSTPSPHHPAPPTSFPGGCASGGRPAPYFVMHPDRLTAMAAKPAPKQTTGGDAQQVWIPNHPYASASVPSLVPSFYGAPRITIPSPPSNKVLPRLPSPTPPSPRAWSSMEVDGPRSPVPLSPIMGGSEGPKGVQRMVKGEKRLGPLQQSNVEQVQARSPVNAKEKGRLAKIWSRLTSSPSPESRAHTTSLPTPPPASHRATTKAKTPKHSENDELPRTSFMDFSPAPSPLAQALSLSIALDHRSVRKTRSSARLGVPTPRAPCSPRGSGPLPPSPATPTSPMSPVSQTSCVSLVFSERSHKVGTPLTPVSFDFPIPPASRCASPNPSPPVMPGVTQVENDPGRVRRGEGKDAHSAINEPGCAGGDDGAVVALGLPPDLNPVRV
ncbi:hypothetical protein HWV62_33651 [Athelia sp. TMB]|nr:hypothetical protein HWV62_33651 [Athelia sp. TMB]